MPAPSSDVDDDVRRTRTTRSRRKKGRSWARRRHLGWITIGSALVVLVVGLIIVVATWDSGRTPISKLAAASGTAPVPSTTPPASTAPASSAPPTTSSSPQNTAVRGTIDSVGENRYAITTATGLKYTVIVTADTTFNRNTGFDSFKDGDAIAVRGTLSAAIITATTIGPASAR